jgi:hypothetical protein
MFKRLGVFRTRLLIELFPLAHGSIPLFEKEGRGEILLDKRGENPPVSPFWQRGIKCAGAIPKKWVLDKTAPASFFGAAFFLFFSSVMD